MAGSACHPARLLPRLSCMQPTTWLFFFPPRFESAAKWRVLRNRVCKLRDSSHRRAREIKVWMVVNVDELTEVISPGKGI